MTWSLQHAETQPLCKVATATTSWSKPFRSRQKKERGTQVVCFSMLVEFCNILLPTYIPKVVWFYRSHQWHLCRWATRLQEKKEACKREAHESCMAQRRMCILCVFDYCRNCMEFSNSFDVSRVHCESWCCQRFTFTPLQHVFCFPELLDTSSRCWEFGSWFTSDCSMGK